MLATQSLWQTMFYYLNVELNAITDAASLILTLITISPAFLIKSNTIQIDNPAKRFSWLWTTLPLFIASTSVIYILRATALAKTLSPISTPWPLLPNGMLFAIGLMILAGLVAGWKSKRPGITIFISMIATASIMSIIPLIYVNGFGFDGFLHRASMNILLQEGTLQPKPPYYIGLYVLLTWLSRLMDISINSIDRWFMTAIMPLLPLFIAWSTNEKKRAAFMSIGTLLILPFAPFVTTTPQAVAYIVGIFAISAALANIHVAGSLILAAWSMAIHPLAGLPFFCVTLGIMFHKRWIKWLWILAAGCSVPLAFFLLGQVSDNQVTFDLARLIRPEFFEYILSRLQPPTNRVALWADAASLFELLRLPLLMIASLFAIKKGGEHKKQWTVLFYASVLLILSGFFLQTTGDFPFLIDYERGNYSERLFVIAQLLLLIPAVAALSEGFKRLPALSLASSTFLLFIVPAIASANIYTSFPRHDAASVSRGWSVGIHDQEAVRWIDRDAGPEPYTVLANQSVSAAAVELLGFKRYAENIFFYPIPTGGPLYQQFLAIMNPENDLEPIKKAAQLGQSKLVYIVLNEYWWDAKKVAEHLSALADAEKTLGENQVMIYRFKIN